MSICQENDIAFISLTNKGYFDFTKNCYKSLEKCEADFTFTSYVLDEETYNKFLNMQVPCQLVSTDFLEQNISSDSKLILYRDSDWGKMMYIKMTVIYKLLLKHKYVCITDGDITYENKNFMQHCLDNLKNHDILFQNNSLDCRSRSICAGFAFIKSTELSKQLYNVTDISFKAIRTEQGYLNSKIKSLKVDIGYLSLDLFPNGRYFYKHHKTIKPYLIHFNWIKSNLKIGKMNKYNKWYLEKSINVNISAIKTKKCVKDICNKIIKENNMNLIIEMKKYNNFFTDISKGVHKFFYIEYVDTKNEIKKDLFTEKHSCNLHINSINSAYYYIKN